MEQFLEAEVIDARHLKLKEPIENPPGSIVIITIEHSDDAIQVAESQEWFQISAKGLEEAYSPDEPEYPLEMIKEPNPEYHP